MHLEIIHGFYKYNNWANSRILETAGKLSHEQLTAETHPSFGSIHLTLLHILNWQWLWLNRWKGVSVKGKLDPSDFPDLPTLKSRWGEVERETKDYIASVKEEDMGKVNSYVNFRGVERSQILWQQMVHQVNHATQHRSEVAMILTNFDFSPGPMDFLVFVDQVLSK